MTAKHVTVEGLAAVLQTIAKYEHGKPWEWWTPRDDSIGTSEEFATAILDALPDDCPAEAVCHAAMAWYEMETLRQSLDADTDDVAWHDAMVMTVDALNGLRDSLAAHDRRVKGGE